MTRAVAQAACLPYREPPACHGEAGSKPAIRQTGSLRYGCGALAGQLQLPLKTDTKEMVLSTPTLGGKNVFIRADSALWRLGE